jgi:formate hydrogenlyase subunit 3/multisubunit Na+/H+ antiporter MnhD subunit
MILPVDLTRFCLAITLIFTIGALAGFLTTRLVRFSSQNQAHKPAWLAMSLALWLATAGGALMAGLGLWYFRWDAAHGGAGRAVVGAVPVQIGLPLWQQNPIRGLYLDALAALFLLFAGFLIVCVAIYSHRWLADHPKRHTLAGGFNLFALSLLWVLLANDLFWLLLSLQLTILTSGYLLLEHSWERKPSAWTRTALQTYLIVGQIGLLCLGVALLILAAHYKEGFNFDVFRGREILTLVEIETLGHRPLPLFAHAAFMLGLIGIGIWVGLVPFHVWVPLVHPQLPTNIQALLTGLGLKVGI